MRNEKLSLKNKFPLFTWLSKLNKLTQWKKLFHTVLLHLYLAHPATFLASKYNISLRTASLLSYETNTYFRVCIITSLILAIFNLYNTNANIRQRPTMQIKKHDYAHFALPAYTMTRHKIWLLLSPVNRTEIHTCSWNMTVKLTESVKWCERFFKCSFNPSFLSLKSAGWISKKCHSSSRAHLFSSS